MINVFVDVTGRDDADMIVQHQKHFPNNEIARWEIDGRVFVKVPYDDGELPAEGMTRDEFEAFIASKAPVEMTGI